MANIDGSKLADLISVIAVRFPSFTVHAKDAGALDAQLERVATDRIVRGDDATMVLYEGPIMLNKGKFLSVLTLTITAAEEVRPRKFFKVSVIVYDVGVRYRAKMLIGVEIWPL